MGRSCYTSRPGIHPPQRVGGNDERGSVAKVPILQGTGSDVGKSVLVAGLCRVLRNDGVRVAPFKPQNMALNSFITADGGEMGRGPRWCKPKRPVLCPTWT